MIAGEESSKRRPGVNQEQEVKSTEYSVGQAKSN